MKNKRIYLRKLKNENKKPPIKLKRKTMYSPFSSISYISFSNNIKKIYFYPDIFCRFIFSFSLIIYFCSTSIAFVLFFLFFFSFNTRPLPSFLLQPNFSPLYFLLLFVGCPYLDFPHVLMYIYI